MRKIVLVMLLVMGTVLIVAGGAVFAQLRTGSYSSTKVDSIGQTLAPQTSSDGNFAVAPFPSFAPQLAEGEGRAETESFCAMCHSTRYITMQPPLAGATWEAEVNKMTKTFGAPIPDATAKKIISYLQTHYTPETRKR